MKTFNLIIILLIGLFIGCSEDVRIEIGGCVDLMLEKHDMVEYRGQKIGCRLLLQLYDYKGEQYYMLHGPCFDMEVFLIDCDGKKKCENGSNSECEEFYKNLINFGIVGISKKRE